MEHSDSNIKKISYIFSKKKAFLIFGKQKPRKNYLYFRKRNSLIFQEIKLSELKKSKELTLKKFLLFRGMELSGPKKVNKTPLGETEQPSLFTACSSIQFLN